MKKILYLMLASVVLFASCAKDPIENTATVGMAGEWYVTVDVVDETGEVIKEDPYGMAPNLIYESNVQISAGKITYGGATTPAGKPADAIEFLLQFDDDDYGFVYKVHGYRYTGLASDE